MGAIGVSRTGMCKEPHTKRGVHFQSCRRPPKVTQCCSASMEPPQFILPSCTLSALRCAARITFLATRAKIMHSNQLRSFCCHLLALANPCRPAIAHCSAKSDSPIRIRRPIVWWASRCAQHNPPPLANLALLRPLKQDKPEALVWPKILEILCPAAWLWLCVLSTTPSDDDLVFCLAGMETLNTF